MSLPGPARLVLVVGRPHDDDSGFRNDPRQELDQGLRAGRRGDRREIANAVSERGGLEQGMFMLLRGQA